MNLVVHFVGDTDDRLINFEDYSKFSVMQRINTWDDVMMEDVDTAVLTTNMQHVCQLTDV